MNHDQATAIAKAKHPDLTIDPSDPAVPNCLVIRRTPNGMPHSIHLPSVGHLMPEAGPDEIAARETASLELALEQSVPAL